MTICIFDSLHTGNLAPMSLAPTCKYFIVSISFVSLDFCSSNPEKTLTTPSGTSSIRRIFFCGPAGPKDPGYTEFPSINGTWVHVTPKPSPSAVSKFKIDADLMVAGPLKVHFWCPFLSSWVRRNACLMFAKHWCSVCESHLTPLLLGGGGLSVYRLLCTAVIWGYHSGLRICWQFFTLEWHCEFVKDISWGDAVLNQL